MKWLPQGDPHAASREHRPDDRRHRQPSHPGPRSPACHCGQVAISPPCVPRRLAQEDPACLLPSVAEIRLPNAQNYILTSGAIYFQNPQNTPSLKHPCAPFQKPTAQGRAVPTPTPRLLQTQPLLRRPLQQTQVTPPGGPHQPNAVLLVLQTQTHAGRPSGPDHGPPVADLWVTAQPHSPADRVGAHPDDG